MHWLFGADDSGGPAYCEACADSRGDPRPCEGCRRPRILPQCADAVDVFKASLSQWVREGAAWKAMIYPGAESVARGLGVEWSKVFPHIRLMEAEVIILTKPGNERGD